jgi:hypothetical protein
MHQAEFDTTQTGCCDAEDAEHQTGDISPFD